jgi:nitroreductase
MKVVLSMDAYAAIYSRRTIRDFKEKEIDLFIIKKIINAGLQAPSNDHMREWEFIVIYDQTERIKLLEKVSQDNSKQTALSIIDSWGLMDNCQREMYLNGIPKQYQMLLSAGCLIIPCFRQKSSLLRPENLSDLNPFASIWCCIQNMFLAATSEGIFGVTRIPFDDEIEHIKSITSIPEGYEIPCYIAMGYPKENAKKVKQQTINVEDRVHINKW